MSKPKETVNISGLEFEIDELPLCPDCGRASVSVELLDDGSARLRSSCSDCDYIETTEMMF